MDEMQNKIGYSFSFIDRMISLLFMATEVLDENSEILTQIFFVRLKKTVKKRALVDVQT